MLLAGGSTYNSSNIIGLIAFIIADTSLVVYWHFGSAYKIPILNP